MKFLLPILLSTATWLSAQTALPLWPEGAPGALGTKEHDIPTITPHLASAANASGAAIVIFPGGGYGGLAGHEGKAYADFFVSNGISRS